MVGGRVGKLLQIDTVLTLPFPGFSRAGNRSWRSPYQQALRSARHLRSINYTSAVILRPDHWWEQCWLSWPVYRKGSAMILPTLRPF